MAYKKYLVWLLLALPSVPILADFIVDQRYYSEMMYDSGVLSTQLLLISMAVTPLAYLSREFPVLVPFSRWMMSQRRYVGVACFGYAVIHLLLYIRQYPHWLDIALQMIEPKIAVGWIGLLILIPLAITSNNYSVSKLGIRWKSLHRLIYLAAGFIYLHWLLIGFFLDVLHLWFLPLIGFQLFRIWLRMQADKPVKD